MIKLKLDDKIYYCFECDTMEFTELYYLTGKAKKCTKCKTIYLNQDDIYKAVEKTIYILKETVKELIPYIKKESVRLKESIKKVKGSWPHEYDPTIWRMENGVLRNKESKLEWIEFNLKLIEGLLK